MFFPPNDTVTFWKGGRASESLSICWISLVLTISPTVTRVWGCHIKYHWLCGVYMTEMGHLSVLQTKSQGTYWQGLLLLETVKKLVSAFVPGFCVASGSVLASFGIPGLQLFAFIAMWSFPCMCYRLLTCIMTQVMSEQATSMTSSQQIISATALCPYKDTFWGTPG